VAEQEHAHRVGRFDPRREIRERFFDTGLRRLLVGQERNVRVRRRVLLLRRLDEARRPGLKLRRVLFVPRHAGDHQQMRLLRKRWRRAEKTDQKKP
jgi:hypothetical protein